MFWIFQNKSGLFHLSQYFKIDSNTNIINELILISIITVHFMEILDVSDY